MRAPSLSPRYGQALVETTLLLPLMLVLTMGVMDLGFTFHAYLQVVNSSREGARAAAEYRYLYSSTSNANSSYTVVQNDSNRATVTAVGADDSYEGNAQQAARNSLDTLTANQLQVVVTYPGTQDTGADPTRSGLPVQVETSYAYTPPVLNNFGPIDTAITLHSTTRVMIRNR